MSILILLLLLLAMTQMLPLTLKQKNRLYKRQLHSMKEERNEKGIRTHAQKKTTTTKTPNLILSVLP